MDFVAPGAVDVVHAEVKVNDVDGEIGGNGDVGDGCGCGTRVVESGVGEGVCSGVADCGRVAHRAGDGAGDEGAIGRLSEALKGDGGRRLRFGVVLEDVEGGGFVGDTEEIVGQGAWIDGDFEGERSRRCGAGEAERDEGFAIQTGTRTDAQGAASASTVGLRAQIGAGAGAWCIEQCGVGAGDG